jgi:low temperature requirement protein LtrA
MAHDVGWSGVVRGLLVLGVLWWSWVGYAWLTSVVDPEEGAVRLTMFAAMAALLVAALCVPHVFGSSGGEFAAAYAVVRGAHIVLFLLASRDDPALRRSVIGLAVSTALGVALLGGAALLDGVAQGLLWGVALLADMLGPYLFGSEGWKLVPRHFAERHGLIVLIALGESIVAIGVGSSAGVDAGVVAAAAIGTVVTGALWWLYFDVVALVAARRLENSAPGKERNEIARDSFSYLHFPMVAGIVLVALGFKKTLAEVSEPLHTVPATALCGGIAIYLLAHVAFRLRNVHRFSSARTIAAAVCLALIPLATHADALVTMLVLSVLLATLIVYENARFAELRERLRHQAQA